MLVYYLLLSHGDLSIEHHLPNYLFITYFSHSMAYHHRDGHTDHHSCIVAFSLVAYILVDPPLGTYSRPTLISRLAKVYPFKRDVVSNNFMNLLKKHAFLLPKPIVLKEMGNNDDPNYSTYHHRLGYTIEYCISFNN